MKRRSFTLLELLLVLAIITAISSLGVASYRRQHDRAQFKSAVIDVQIDLNRARLLAMRSGTAYFFRYAPGTGYYEIGPLPTLQEAIYRRNGELVADDYSPYGGSLDASYSAYGPTEYDDDLFSAANIQADLAASTRGRTNPASQASVLGGGLSTAPPASPYSGGEFALDEVLSNNLSAPPTITLREMNTEERAIGAKPNTIAWRVNSDGLIVRKLANYGLFFTYERISESTPTNLRDRRPGGVRSETTATSPVEGPGEDLGSSLGGSLTSIPTPKDSGSGLLGGGLSSAPNESEFLVDGLTSSFEPETTSIWSEPILFYPNGKTSTAAIGMTNDGNHRYYSEIALRGMTGYARVSGISALPPGSDLNPSALTQEQLFRLGNPEGVGEATPGTGALDGSFLSSTPEKTAGSLLPPPLGVDEAFDASPDPFDSSQNSITSGFTPAYGSTERRSQYRFDTSSNVAGGALDAQSLPSSGFVSDVPSPPTNAFANAQPSSSSDFTPAPSLVPSVETATQGSPFGAADGSLVAPDDSQGEEPRARSSRAATRNSNRRGGEE